MGFVAELIPGILHDGDWASVSGSSLQTRADVSQTDHR